MEENDFLLPVFPGEAHFTEVNLINAQNIWIVEYLLKFYSCYRKSPNFSDAQNVWCNHPKIQIKRFYHMALHPKDADSIANSEDPDQTAPLGAV